MYVEDVLFTPYSARFHNFGHNPALKLGTNKKAHAELKSKAELLPFLRSFQIHCQPSIIHQQASTTESIFLLFFCRLGKSQRTGFSDHAAIHPNPHYFLELNNHNR